MVGCSIYLLCENMITGEGFSFCEVLQFFLLVFLDGNHGCSILLLIMRVCDFPLVGVSISSRVGIRVAMKTVKGQEGRVTFQIH